jgi:hypothetical protein
MKLNVSGDRVESSHTNRSCRKRRFRTLLAKEVSVHAKTAELAQLQAG